LERLILWKVFTSRLLMESHHSWTDDAGMRDEVQAWLEEARWNMKDAEILLSAQRWNSAAFSAHQAVEKAVKALLCYVNQSPWGHVSSEPLP
jgi:hypothetical protein